MKAPQSLIKYEPSVIIKESSKAYHQRSGSQIYDPLIPPRQQQIIDAILPPRDWTDHNNKLHIQYVSHQPATRDDVLDLTKLLEKMLDDRQARKNGICGIREQLFSQTFDQLIRQVAIDSSERGLLLMRVRDQRKMTHAAYQTVFQSSVSYGMQKIVQTQCEESQEQLCYTKLNKMRDELIKKKFKLLCNKDLIQKEFRENQAYNKQKRTQQMKFLQLQQQNMKKFLQAVKEERQGK